MKESLKERSKQEFGNPSIKQQNIEKDLHQLDLSSETRLVLVLLGCDSTCCCLKFCNLHHMCRVYGYTVLLLVVSDYDGRFLLKEFTNAAEWGMHIPRGSLCLMLFGLVIPLSMLMLSRLEVAAVWLLLIC